MQIDVESANNDNSSKEILCEEEQEVEWNLSRLGKIPIKSSVLKY